jgi:hypothetical protein
MATYIELGDGSSFAMEDSHWKIAASATAPAFRTDGLTSARLIVRTNDRGSVLIYSEIKSPEGAFRAGEVLPPESPGIISALQSIACLYGLPTSCFDSCLEQLYRK